MPDIPHSPEDDDGDAALQEWLNVELLAKGPQVVRHPLLGWSCATLPDKYLSIGIGYLEKPSQPSILRLVLTRSQAQRLGHRLEDLARTPHVTAPDKPN